MARRSIGEFPLGNRRASYFEGSAGPRSRPVDHTSQIWVINSSILRSLVVCATCDDVSRARFLIQKTDRFTTPPL
ncbi:MAG: hypothetical protein DME46_02450 [Verrucomicrobia bacterium]|nr:MAG: hypothetical protein DME46_02450 [Verrucomicrobiota bacterium]